MYMGVILVKTRAITGFLGAPHVYGGDPLVGLRGTFGL